MMRSRSKPPKRIKSENIKDPEKKVSEEFRFLLGLHLCFSIFLVSQEMGEFVSPFVYLAIGIALFIQFKGIGNRIFEPKRAVVEKVEEDSFYLCGKELRSYESESREDKFIENVKSLRVQGGLLGFLVMIVPAIIVLGARYLDNGGTLSRSYDFITLWSVLAVVYLVRILTIGQVLSVVFINIVIVVFATVWNTKDISFYHLIFVFLTLFTLFVLHRFELDISHLGEILDKGKEKSGRLISVAKRAFLYALIFLALVFGAHWVMDQIPMKENLEAAAKKISEMLDEEQSSENSRTRKESPSENEQMTQSTGKDRNQSDSAQSESPVDGSKGMQGATAEKPQTVSLSGEAIQKAQQLLNAKREARMEPDILSEGEAIRVESILERMQALEGNKDSGQAGGPNLNGGRPENSVVSEQEFEAMVQASAKSDREALTHQAVQIRSLPALNEGAEGNYDLNGELDILLEDLERLEQLGERSQEQGFDLRDSKDFELLNQQIEERARRIEADLVTNGKDYKLPPGQRGELQRLLYSTQVNCSKNRNASGNGNVSEANTQSPQLGKDRQGPLSAQAQLKQEADQKLRENLKKELEGLISQSEDRMRSKEAEYLKQVHEGQQGMKSNTGMASTGMANSQNSQPNKSEPNNSKPNNSNSRNSTGQQSSQSGNLPNTSDSPRPPQLPKTPELPKLPEVPKLNVDTQKIFKVLEGLFYFVGVIAIFLLIQFLLKALRKPKPEDAIEEPKERSREDILRLKRELQNLERADLTPSEEIIQRYNFFLKLLDGTPHAHPQYLPAKDYEAYLTEVTPNLRKALYFVTEKFCDHYYAGEAVDLLLLQDYRKHHRRLVKHLL